MKYLQELSLFLQSFHNLKLFTELKVKRERGGERGTGEGGGGEEEKKREVLRSKEKPC